jgi:hypothetical protein
MKKPIASLLAMNLSLEGRALHLFMHAVRSVLILSAASLLFSCGIGTVQDEPIVAADPVLSLSPPAASPAIQCSDVATISAGLYHTVGLNKNKTVVAAGDNTYSQLSVTSWTDIKAIAAGAYHTVGLKDDGTVVAAGYSMYNDMDVLTWTDITAIAAGEYNTIGLKKDGTVVYVGYKSNLIDVSSWTNIKAVAAGSTHAAGLTGDGNVVVAIASGVMDVSSWTNITAIASGRNHMVGLKDDKTVVVAGANTYGQLDVLTWTDIKAIATGKKHTVGLKENGTVVAVGDNTYGQLDVLTWTNIKAIAAGDYNTFGLTGDGKVVATGDNSKGQLDVASLFTSIMPICGSAVLDVTPPMMTTMMTGTLGKNGRYVSDVEMTLLATDNDGGSGVKEVHYNIDGKDAIVSGCSTSLSIVSDGTHTVTFFARDNAGNDETPQVMTINIKKAESSDLDEDSACFWPPNHKMVNIKIRGSVNHCGSEIDSTIITITDNYKIHKMPPLHGFEHAIPLESWREDTDMDGRSYTIDVVVTDKAGRQSKKTKKVCVLPHDKR